MTSKWSLLTRGYNPPMYLTEISCGPLSAVQFSTNSVTNGDNLFGDVATYVCDSYYTLSSGNLMRTCQSNGNWSGTAPICQGIILQMICVKEPCLIHSRLPGAKFNSNRLDMMYVYGKTLFRNWCPLCLLVTEYNLVLPMFRN